MLTETTRIRISFVWGVNNRHCIDERVARAEALIAEHAGSVESKQVSPKAIEIIAVLPAHIVLFHHSFESILNKSWPYGCEASGIGRTSLAKSKR